MSFSQARPRVIEGHLKKLTCVLGSSFIWIGFGKQQQIFEIRNSTHPNQ
jgi:hypothetical protein